MRLLVLAVLLLPLAAGAPFEGSMEDRANDVVTRDFRPFERPSTDILNVTSRIVEGTRVEQRVAMAAPPTVEENSIIVRSWFRNSTNGSFYTVDLEVHADAEQAETFVAYTRRGAFENVTRIDATWAIEGSEWVFTFDAAEAAPDAECFLPMVYAYFAGPDGAGAFDSIGMTGRPCATAPEPNDAAPGSNTPRFPSVVARVPDNARDEATPTVDAPGTRTPAPGASVALVLAAVGVALLSRKWV